MGASLKDPRVKSQLDELRTDTQDAARELKLDEMQSALDLAGMADPTPVCDAASALISVARGDWFGAGMSLVSMIPYAGDAIGKTAKGARLLKRLAKLKRRIADNVARGRQIVADALKKDAEAIRAKRALAKAEKIEEGVINGCPVGGNRFGTQSPKEGWGKGERGNGEWDPGKSGLDKDKVKKIESVTGGKPVRFENGNPDFSEYVHQTKGADGKLVDAKVEIELDRAGNRENDFRAAREAMAEKLGVEHYEEPKGWTWHHKEDGTTMELIPSALHNNVPHSGSVSVAKDPSY
ncbi:MAG: HNH endonuclease [Rhodocyclaceae bacterium]|nr:HNH endonuclease [Rhodocyclaceae bacterium]